MSTSNREVNIRDVINRTHPKPQDELRDEIFERLMRGDLDKYPDVEPLESPETWEVKVSEYAEEARREAEGDDLPSERVEEKVEDAKAQAYRELIDKGKLPIFAKTRNIRNMLEAGLEADEIFTDDDLEYAENSKMYPFRFYQAYKAVKNAGYNEPPIEEFLSKAIDATSDNLPESIRDTFVAVDLSGSMDHNVSRNSVMTYKEIGTLFGALMMKHGAETGGFGDDFELVTAHYDTPTLELQDKILSVDHQVGNSTNGWKALRHLYRESKEYDRVVIFTDMQIWDSTGGLFGSSDHTVKDYWDKYKAEFPDATLYMIDLNNHGNLVTPEGYPDVYNLQGWNSRVIDYIRYAENENTLLNDIKGVDID